MVTMEVKSTISAKVSPMISSWLGKGAVEDDSHELLERFGFPGSVPGALDDDSWLISTRFPSPSYAEGAIREGEHVARMRIGVEQSGGLVACAPASREDA